MAYESPISLMISDMNMALEGEILKAVQSIDVSVNKEELCKALRYDRNQYDKGYSDARSEMIRSMPVEAAVNVLVANGWVTCTYNGELIAVFKKGEARSFEG